MLSEIRILSRNYDKALRNPLLFPEHIQKLHQLALKVRKARDIIGVTQSSLEEGQGSLETAERVIYAIYNKHTPELYFIASKTPAAIDFYNLYRSSLHKDQQLTSLTEWISRHDINDLGLYLLESGATIVLEPLPADQCKGMMLSRKCLYGLGNSSCKAISVLTQDGPYRHFKFKLRPIRKDYWNVLCMANESTLYKTATELINELPSLENDKIRKHKSNGFWTVFSKRFKASIQIMKVHSIVEIIKAFHMYDKDTGVYVVAVNELRNRVEEFDGRSLVDCSWVLSRRLKKNTQKEFFRSLAEHVPNILYQLNGLDILKVLWNLNNAGYDDVQICRNVHRKFNEFIPDLNEEDLSGACLAFGRFGYRNLEFYDRIQSQIRISNVNVLFQLSWGLYLAGINVSEVIKENEDILSSSIKNMEKWKLQIFKDIFDTADGVGHLTKAVEEELRAGERT